MIIVLLVWVLCFVLLLKNMRTGKTGYGLMAYMLLLCVIAYAQPSMWVAMLIIMLAPGFMWALRIAWVYDRTRRLMVWSDEHGLDLSDADAHWMAQTFDSTFDAKQYFTLGRHLGWYK